MVEVQGETLLVRVRVRERGRQEEEQEVAGEAVGGDPRPTTASSFGQRHFTHMRGMRNSPPIRIEGRPGAGTNAPAFQAMQPGIP